MCPQVDRFHPGLRKLDLHAWVAFSQNSKKQHAKASLDFRELFLVAGGYMQRSFWKLSSKCCFFLDLWHACHEPQNYLFGTLELILHIDLGALTPYNTSRSLQHIQLSYFRVSLLNLSFDVFMSLSVFWLV